ncbi:MAG: bifunctional diaminohydroxyphosphoribosylaminopyrimidine deaminase/5-amino-6-(5-phosphoribosylamino)uracil reductase RibD [Acidobacteria bacterium]|nr:bifunctional diaminohydroxyphosphoribosylaminopyrimidine deaminase/5-amino-6-(5-phosphoribosylamino)uracil reductase RibD [Acidobacteriota bacterium]
MDDVKYMQQVLKLAAKGQGQVSPNPMVGALVVKSDVVLGRGYHRYETLDHAEINALREAGSLAIGATLYVNLEPCCHHGRTPPCTDAILRSGVHKVVVAITDPNPLVGGKGLHILQLNGIEVVVGVCEKEAKLLNEKFITFITNNRPFVLLKTAMTLDGKIATHTRHSKWITSEASRQASQLLRAEYDAILAGAGTIVDDDPELTLRIEARRHRALIRVIVDGRLSTPLTAKILTTADINPVLIFADEMAASKAHGGILALQARVKEYEARGAQVIFEAGIDGQVSLSGMLAELTRRKITSLIVEGGANITGQFLTEKLFDKATFFIAPKLIGGSRAISAVGGEGFSTLDQAVELENIEITRHQQDIQVTGYPKLVSKVTLEN